MKLGTAACTIMWFVDRPDQNIGMKSQSQSASITIEHKAHTPNTKFITIDYVYMNVPQKFEGRLVAPGYYQLSCPALASSKAVSEMELHEVPGASRFVGRWSEGINEFNRRNCGLLELRLDT